MTMAGNSDVSFQTRLTDTRENIADIYNSRSVLRSLVHKDLFGHYKNSIIGFGWHFIIPMIMLAVYYVVFSTIRQGSLPDFWVFLASALFPFHFMISNLTAGSGVIVGGAGMIKKMYFPREIIVFAKVISSFIVMIMGYLVILVTVIASGFQLNIGTMALLPVFLILMCLFSTGYCLFFSSLTVYVRDIQYLLNSISMVFYFVTPMYFVADSVSGMFGTIIWLNPFTYYVEAFHQIVYYGMIPEMKIIVACALMPLVTLIIGFAVFNKLKRGFAERL